MKDTVVISKETISIQLSVIVQQKDDVTVIGYIPSFELPFTSPSEEKAGEIAKGLVNALMTKWLKDGGIKLLQEKLDKFGFYSSVELHGNQFEHLVPTTSFQIRQELHVA